MPTSQRSDDQFRTGPTDTAHIAICRGCEEPQLVSQCPADAAALVCPACGTIIEPSDIHSYERVIHDAE